MGTVHASAKDNHRGLGATVVIFAWLPRLLRATSAARSTHGMNIAPAVASAKASRINVECLRQLVDHASCISAWVQLTLSQLRNPRRKPETGTAGVSCCSWVVVTMAGVRWNSESHALPALQEGLIAQQGTSLEEQAAAMARRAEEPRASGNTVR
jgi:hypothetical protein